MNRRWTLGAGVAASAFALELLATPGSKVEAQVYEPLEGVLFSGRIAAIANADRPLPKAESFLSRIVVYVADPGALGLRSGTREIIAELSSDKRSSLSLVKTMETPPAIVQRTIPKSVGVAPGVRSRVEISTTVAVAPVAKRENRETFSSVNALLEGSTLSFPLYGRVTRGGITVEVDRLAKREGAYLLRFSVANNSLEEFFMSKVLLYSKGVLVSSRPFVPFSCRPKEVVHGVLRFMVDESSGKRLSLVLSESGGQERRYEIKDLGFAF